MEHKVMKGNRDPVTTREPGRLWFVLESLLWAFAQESWSFTALMSLWVCPPLLLPLRELPVISMAYSKTCHLTGPE
jgi:hypothetical protein